MKKMVALFLVLSMALLIPAGAFAAPDDLKFFGVNEEGYYEEMIENGIARVGDALYFHGNNGIYSWKPGDTELTTVYQPYGPRTMEGEQGAEPGATEAPSAEGGDEPVASATTAPPSEDEADDAAPDASATTAPPSEDEAASTPEATDGPANAEEDQPQVEHQEYSLHGMFDLDGVPATINLQDGKIYEVKEGEVVATDYLFDIDSLPGSTGEMYMDKQLIRDISYDNGKLYMICYPSDAQWGETLLNVCDLSTGKIESITDTSIRFISINNYKPGKLLLAMEPSYSARSVSEDEQYMRVQVWDIASGAFEGDPFTPFKGYNIRSVAYDPEADMIYFMQSNRIMGGKYGEEAKVVNYMQGDIYSDLPAAVIGEYMAVASWEGLFICSIDPEKAPKRVLKVSGDYSSEATGKFLADHPDLALDFVDSNMYSIESISTTLASGDAPDIFVFGTYGNIGALIEKGYAADLSGSAELMAAADKLYPQIKDAIIYDGKLYGYPRWFSMGLWSYAPKAFEEVGLGDFPETMAEFMDLVVLWERDYQEDYPEKKLIDFYDDPKTMLFSLILQQYVAFATKPDEPISFNTPEFRAVMEKLDSLPMEFETDDDDNYARAMTVEYVEPMIETYGYLEGYYNEYPKMLMLPPKLSADSEPFAAADMDMYVVNPNSEMIDLAIEYIVFMTENMQNSTRYAISPELNEPVENSYYQRNIEQMQEYYDELKAKEVDPSEQREHEAQLEEYEKYMEDEERYRWEISAESIERYRELAPYIKVQTSYELYNGESGEELQKIIMRYRDGQLSVDQMIREMDQKSQMIFLETR